MNKHSASPLLWQPARIVDDGDGQRWLEFESVSDCARCRAGTGCGASQWARLFGRGSVPRMALRRDCALPAGSEVRAGLSAGALLIAAGRVYLLPLLVFIVALISLDRWGVAEPLALLAGFVLSFSAVFLGRGRRVEGRGEIPDAASGRLNPVIELRRSPCPKPGSRSD